jgi:hypothetical protein
LTRRILFSIAVVAAIVTMIVVASDVKRHIEMVLHAYDVVLSDLTIDAEILWVDHRVT